MKGVPSLSMMTVMDPFLMPYARSSYDGQAIIQDDICHDVQIVPHLGCFQHVLLQFCTNSEAINCTFKTSRVYNLNCNTLFRIQSLFYSKHHFKILFYASSSFIFYASAAVISLSHFIFATTILLDQKSPFKVFLIFRSICFIIGSTFSPL